MSVEPIEIPGDIPGPNPDIPSVPPPSYVPGYLGYSVKRYTCNVAVTEEMKVIDFINEVLFPSSRMYLSQGSNGKLKMRHKRPVTWALAAGAVSSGAGSIDVDDVSGWVENPKNLLLIDPYTPLSEVHELDSVSYSAAQNSVTLTSSANITVAGFSGASGRAPAQATATVTGTNSGSASHLTLDGVALEFTAGTADTVSGIAAFLATAINAHPKLARRFSATVAGAVVTIKGKFGTINLTTPTVNNHPAPLANPTAAPTAAGTGSGSALAAGTYKFAYSFVNERGQTLLSPVGQVTISAGEKIAVSAVTLPSGASLINWYIQPQPGSNRLRLHATNDGAAFTIESLPLLTATLPPDYNRTGAEIMRVMSSFSDRAEPRAGRAGSNVLQASYEWLLGNRTKSVNRIDLKYRDAIQDYRAIELRISDRKNIAKIKKTSSLEINGQAIDNTFQAVRIATSLLAEHRDADFFYKWRSTREALLLEEGDVVAITDDGSGVVNLPVMIEEMEIVPENCSLPRVSFRGRKYSSSLYDDSISDRKINLVIEN